MTNGYLAKNPAKEVILEAPKSIQERFSDFTSGEAKAILRAALGHTAAPQEHPRTAAAKKWAPWICAYTGARIGEVLQLRKKDLTKAEDDAGWMITITPEAGTTKSKLPREVSVHPHLIELGFAKFAEASPDGYLFVSNSKGSLNGVKNRVTEFVREYVPDRRVRPNHGWRHLFKTIGRDAGIDFRVLDAICGHAPETVGGDYGRYSVKAQRRALKKFPRFSI